MMRGGCLCGQVQFDAVPDRHVIACHCSQCRKQSGHFWAATFAWHKDFQLIRSDGLRWFDASDKARRGFCAGCGAFLFWQPQGEDRISIAAGAFDGATGLSVEESWHNEDAGDYYHPDGTAPDRPTFAPHLQGRCLCGENRFALPGPMGDVTACHCNQCRKTSGHYAAWFDTDEAKLVWAARNITEYNAANGGTRAFCPTCGSKLYSRTADAGFALAAAAVDNPTAGHLSRHVFVADMGDYYKLTDGQPQFPGAAEGL